MNTLVAKIEELKSGEAEEEFTGSASISDPTSPLCALVIQASFDWTADTGTSTHITLYCHWFSSYKPYVISVRLADGTYIKSASIGSVKFQPSDVKEHILEFEHVLHVPSLKSNLLPVLYLTTKKWFIVNIMQSSMKFYRDNKLLFTATVNFSNTAILNDTTLPMTEFVGTVSVSTCPLDISLWHYCLGHLNVPDVQCLHSKELVSDIDIVDSSFMDPICEPCIDGKQTRHIGKRATTRQKQPLALIHSDLHSSLKVQTPEGYRYWVTFIDDISRYCSIALLKNKSEILVAFKLFRSNIENELGCKIKILKDDKSGEFMSTGFNKYLATAGITRQHAIRNSSHKNGAAKHFNRTLVKRTISLLSEAKLSQSFWGHTVATTVYVRNWSLISALNGKVPYTIFVCKKPDVSHLRVFGCTAYIICRRIRNLVWVLTPRNMSLLDILIDIKTSCFIIS